MFFITVFKFLTGVKTKKKFAFISDFFEIVSTRLKSFPFDVLVYTE